MNCALLGVEDRAAQDVAGQQVGRELQAAEVAGHAAGQGLGHQRLAHAGHVLQQHVLARQQRHEAPADHVGLAQHDAAHVGFELRRPAACSCSAESMSSVRASGCGKVHGRIDWRGYAARCSRSGRCTQPQMLATQAHGRCRSGASERHSIVTDEPPLSALCRRCRRQLHNCLRPFARSPACRSMLRSLWLAVHPPLGLPGRADSPSADRRCRGFIRPSRDGMSDHAGCDHAANLRFRPACPRANQRPIAILVVVGLIGAVAVWQGFRHMATKTSRRGPRSRSPPAARAAAGRWRRATAGAELTERQIAGLGGRRPHRLMATMVNKRDGRRRPPSPR